MSQGQGNCHQRGLTFTGLGAERPGVAGIHLLLPCIPSSLNPKFSVMSMIFLVHGLPSVVEGSYSRWLKFLNSCTHMGDIQETPGLGLPYLQSLWLFWEGTLCFCLSSKKIVKTKIDGPNVIASWLKSFPQVRRDPVSVLVRKICLSFSVNLTFQEK